MEMGLYLCCLCVLMAGFHANAEESGTEDDIVPRSLLPSLDEAIAALTEISQADSIEDIDIHHIPYGPQLLCRACGSTFDFLIRAYKLYVPLAAIKTGLKKLCLILYNGKVCHGVIELNVPVFIDILSRKPDLTSDHVCNTVFEDYCAAAPLVDWAVYIPDRAQPPATSKCLRYPPGLVEVAHLTDTHVDEKYSRGSVNSGCREPICCRNYQGEASDPSEAAGYWGDYLCDIPMYTTMTVLQRVADEHKDITYMYMTGDLIAHNLWETSEEENARQIRDQAEAFRRALQEGVVIFPVLGNHEPHPANVLPPPEVDGVSAAWLYEAFYHSWCSQFPEEAKETFMKGGFYSVSPRPGFRVIGLNTLWGYCFNWWMILYPVDPAGQLQWLVHALLRAESQGERVHILMHGPATEPDQMKVWRLNYGRIINRFHDTIAGQFVGHTHRDQFYLHYSPSRQPVAVTWNGGSITTYTSCNPNYRVYLVNTQCWTVEDYDNYVFNLTESNKALYRAPNWYKNYSFKDAYRVPSLEPKDVHEMVRRMAVSRGLHRQYFLSYLKDSDVAYTKQCDKRCVQNQICKIVNVHNNITHCKRLLRVSKRRSII